MRYPHSGSRAVMWIKVRNGKRMHDGHGKDVSARECCYRSKLPNAGRTLRVYLLY